MKKTLLIALTMVVALSAAAFAGRGEWYMNASESTGSLSAGSHVAYWNRDQGAIATREAGLQWTVLYGSDATTKCIDNTSTVGSGAGATWNLNDGSTSTYDRLAITPGNSVWDNSRGLVMAKIKVNSAGNVNGTFGFSNVNSGLLVCLRDNMINMKYANSDSLTFTAQSVDVKTDYRVYALSWSGSTANVWYSLTNDWSSNPNDWVNIMTDFSMAAGKAALSNGQAAGSTGNFGGILLADLGSANTWDGNIQWVSQTTYDSPALAPWANDPTPNLTPEPGSMLALACGMVGMVGFTLRKKRA